VPLGLGESHLLFGLEAELIQEVSSGTQIDKLLFQSLGVTALVAVLFTMIANTNLDF